MFKRHQETKPYQSIHSESSSPAADAIPVETFTCGFTDHRTGLQGPLSLAQVSTPLNELLKCSITFLSASELRKLSMMTSDRRRESFLRGRAAAKRAICLGFAGTASQWDIASGVFGQPVVSYPLSVKPPVHVSISHSSSTGVALSTPATWPAALDVEEIAERNRAALNNQLTQQERKWCDSSKHPLAAATALWSLKEAASKVLGGGLALDFRLLVIEAQQWDTAGEEIKCRFAHAGHLAGEVAIHGTQVLALVRPAQSSLTDSKILSRAVRRLKPLPSCCRRAKEELR